MDPPDPFTGRPSPTRRSAELQGPRPAPLKVNKDSHKIKKPPIPPQSHHHHFHQPPLLPPYRVAGATTSQSHNPNPQPVIIYSVSPKVIHTTVSDFMNLVQSLTGSTTSQPTGGGAAPPSGDVSPAARFASIENSSPSHRERLSLHSAATAAVAAASSAAAYGIEHSTPSGTEMEIQPYYPSAASGDGAAAYSGAGDDEISRILDQSNYFSIGSQNNYFPGILSPAPATMPPASPPGLFSPAVADPFIQAASNMFIPSPSATWFSAPMVSPSPSSSSYSHLFNSIFDF